MSDFDDLDSLLGPLREPATPAELASERAMIDRMVTSHRNPKGTPMFSSRRARVATLIAAGVIGFGGVAAAGGGLSRTSPDDTPEVDPAPQVIEIEEEVEVEETTTTTTTTTTTAAAAIEEPDDDTLTDEVAKASPEVATADIEDDVDNPDTDFNENDCLDGNHGLTVSEVARGENPLFENVEVRDAAHSDCGKTDDDDATKVDDDDDDANEDESDDDSDDDDEDDEDDNDARGSKGGQGNGNHGKSDKDD